MSMATAPNDDTYVSPPDGYEAYRAIDKAAVASVILGIISFLGFFFPSLLALALFGLMLGILAIRNIRRFPMELVGMTPAVVGVLVSGGVLLAGASYHIHVYATEVPDGYARISFSNLQPARAHPELPVSPESLELDGKKVFIKGYVYPDGQKKNIKKFILVPDMGTCCFGGQPKLTDMIEVTLEDPKRIEYAIKKRKLGGTLRVDTALKPVSGLNGVFYQLEADYVQ